MEQKTYCYTLGEKTENGLYELYRDGVKTRALIANLNFIANPDYAKVLIHGGIFRGGEFYGGRFLGGEFHGGVFYNGIFHGGIYYSGTYKGGLFISGVYGSL
jgi:hypothetical protein